MSESGFLKLFFAFIAACFLIAALCMPDRAQMGTGLVAILTSTCKISTSWFTVGGFSAAFLNMGIVAAACCLLFCIPGAKANNVSTLAFLLTVGFAGWGLNVLNTLPTVLGVCLYCLVRREKLSANVNAMLFSTGIAPLISDLLLRYPNAESIGFNLPGALLALVVGLAIGFFLPAGLAHSPKVHKGFDLYSAALPVGVMAFFLNAVLYKTLGVDLPAVELGDLTIASRLAVNIFCCAVFGLCVVLALALGCRPRDYWRLLTCRQIGVSFSATFGNAAFLMNVGVYGLFILAYYNLIGVSFNAVTFGIIFCMLACCNSGSHPGSVWPIMVGYALFSFVFSWLSGLVGGSFAYPISAQAIAVGLCFANGLSPISTKYGWQYGILAGGLHYLLVTSVPNLHGGYCLYNGGLTAAFICLMLIPILDRFAKTREERLAKK